MDRARNVYCAKLAEQASRYDEMKDYMAAVGCDCLEELSVEERNLLSVAYKNAVGSRRAAWRIISRVEHREKAQGSDTQARYAKEYCETIEKELHEICDTIIQLLGDKDSGIIQKASNGESRVFYTKMKADYYRYIAEFTAGDEKSQAAENARALYQEAQTSAEKDLAVTHPMSLGLALNYSVFQYEVLQESDEACRMATSAFENALAELDSIPEESYKDSTLIMQLLRDNITLWNSDQTSQG